MRIVQQMEVEAVEERFEKRHLRGVGPEAEMQKISCGWYARSGLISFYVGMLKPNIHPGDVLSIVITRNTKS